MLHLSWRHRKAIAMQNKCKEKRRVELYAQFAGCDGDSLYEILGVSENASKDEIKKAYRQKARHVHPDVNKASDASDQFKRLSVAYHTLIDPDKRAQYDTLRKQQNERASKQQHKYQSKQSQSQQRKHSGVFSEAFWADQTGTGDAFYGLGDFLRDCERDWEEARARFMQREKGNTQPSGLWADVAAFGEELLDFLEENQPGELNVSNTAADASADASSSDQRSSPSSNPQENEIEDELQALKAKLSRQHDQNSDDE